MAMRFGIATTIGCFVLGLWVSSGAFGDDVKRVDVTDDKLAYVEAGQGDVIVLVHGGFQDYRLWERHLPVFSKSHRVIAYSRRNHFPNSTSNDGLPDGAADAHGEDLAAALVGLGAKQAHIVAHSSGAHAALFFAANHPEMVRTLVINEPPAAALLAATPTGPDILKTWGARFALSQAALKKGDIDAGVRFFADAVGGPGTYDRRSDSEHRMMLDNAPPHVADATSSRRPAFTCDMARRISAPTLLTNGERSPEFFHRIADELEKCLPNRTRMTIPGASHTVPSENPQAYDEAVLAFIANH
jgi:pimeloyl-ACP methyl ester carboxylesterase